MTNDTFAPQLSAVNDDIKDTTKLTMYGRIGTGWYADISTQQVEEQLKAINSSKIELHISSKGGDVFESLTIHNMLKNHDAEIEVHIDGIAASGGSLIAMAGDKIIMPRNTMMMIHRAASMVFGNSEVLRKTADDLDEIDTLVTQSYLARFSGTQSDLEALLSKEDYIPAEKCLVYGFCDEIKDPIVNQGDPQNLNTIITNQIEERTKKANNLVAAMNFVTSTFN